MTCWNNCIAKSGNPAAQAFWKCALDNDCFNKIEKIKDPQPCIEAKCPNEWAACQKDPKCKPALDDCYKKCGTKESCWALCLPSKGSQAAVDVAKCAQKNGCLSIKSDRETALSIFTPQDCIKEHCPDQSHACRNDPRCMRTLNECEKQCQNNQTCWSNCVAKSGNPAAQAFWKCVVDNDCLNQVESKSIALRDPQKCIEEKCPNEWKACQNDKNCVPTLEDCQKKCGTK